jgi:spore coat protein U-like protein
MTSGPNVAPYNVFLDAGGTQIWGDGTGGSVFYLENFPVDVKGHVVNIYGIMPAGLDIAAGNYTDTIFATLSYSNAVVFE